MNIPLNGRIAIVDDQIEQAAPLMAALSKAQIPFTYFSGEIDYLPEESLNDIRILFLDINLLGDNQPDSKNLKSKLIGVLKRVIAENNFPYVLIYWSRQQHHKQLIEDDIFVNALPERKPIAFLSAMKSDFFDLNGVQSDDFEENIQGLFEKIADAVKNIPAFGHLLNWENKVHNASNEALKEVFQAHNDDWNDQANYMLNKLGESYSGRMFSSQSPADKIKSAYNALTYIINDTLEKDVNSDHIENTQGLPTAANTSDSNLIYSINTKLLFSSDNESLEYSGAIIEDVNPQTDSIFKALLNNSFNRQFVENSISPYEQSKVDKKTSSIRKEIRKTWKKVYMTVTPLCDYVQKKNEYNRCIKGMFITAKYLDYIDNKSEAIFISPQFIFEGVNYVLILNFRYFFTTKRGGNLTRVNPLLRARHELLAEIQSKLSRHISRQGILFLDDRY